MNHYREATQDEIDDPRRHHVQWLAVVPVEDAMSRAEWEATIKDNPVIDMGDDNLWVMVDLGNPDAVGEETP